MSAILSPVPWTEGILSKKRQSPPERVYPVSAAAGRPLLIGG
jgi:hypothetical protein